MTGSNAGPDSIYDRLHNVAIVSSDITNDAPPVIQVQLKAKNYGYRFGRLVDFLC
jgi:hypothetical protein